MNAPLYDFILLIPCYNNQAGLIESLKSINYPPEKFEILIVDDGSATPISKIENIFPNFTIKILRIENNQGIVNALNTGLKHLKNRNDYKYIARLDTGDICHTDRFTKQVDFLNTQKNISLLGTWCTFKTIDTGKTFEYITQTEHAAILKEMHTKCSFIHPTVMFRNEILITVGVYPANFPHAEDYAYFWEIIKKHNGAILPQSLVKISVSSESISSKNYKLQLKSKKKIIAHYGTIIFYKVKGLFLLTLKQITPNFLLHWIKY